MTGHLGWRLAGAILLLALPHPRELAAQTSCTFSNTVPCSFTLNVSLTPSDVLRLTLSSTATAFAAPVEADYTAGYITASGPTATAKANRAYRVTVDSPAATWTYTPVGGLTDPGKAASDLSWATTAGGTFATSAGAAATLLSGAGGTAGTAQPIYFRARLNYATDRPGTYTLTVRYTLSAP
jgi:hypothetical protein